MLYRQLLGIVVAVGLSIGISYVHAWVGPTVAPPNGNVSAPVNVGTSAQVKNGGLSVDALSVFGNQYVSGRLGVGVASPQQKIDIGGTAGVDGIRFPDGTVQTTAATGGGGGSLTGSGSANLIAKWTSASNLANSQITDNATNVGISTTTPGYKFSVNGPIFTNSGVRFPDGTFQTTAASGGGGGQWTTSGSNIYNSNSGNVGIGTTNPVHKFHMSKTDYTPIANIDNIMSYMWDRMTGSSTSYNGIFAFLAEAQTAVTGTGYSMSQAIGGAGWTENDGDAQEAIGVSGGTITYPGDTGYALVASNAGNPSTGGTQYGLYINMANPSVTNWGIYQFTNNRNYLQGNTGVGNNNPQSLLHVGSGGFLQFSRSTAGVPVATDCDNDAERGRLSIDTTNNRLYICNGAVRGWDYIVLTN